MRIAYYASGWPINIGNAFIDYGAIHTIKTAACQASVFCASELPKWLFWANDRDMSKSVDLAELMDIDYLVVSGMSLCDEFITVEGPVLKRLSERGVRIVFNGCGGSTYGQEEIDNFRRFLESINCAAFLSRDEASYHNFKDCCPRSGNGIDCGFFLSEAFKPAPLIIQDYVVSAFDSGDEPDLPSENRRIIRAHHASSDVLPNGYWKRLLTRRTAFVLRRRWPFVQRLRDERYSRAFQQEPALISDIPDDYLHLYAHASAVYSDRVHACVAALSFGRSARLYSNTPRGGLFERVGAGAIRSRLVTLDQAKLAAEKHKHVAFLKSALLQEPS